MKCRNLASAEGYIPIGNPDLIERRVGREVPIPPYGTLSDYVPFYFTPFSPMLYNIKTGYGVERKRNKDIVIFVSSLHKLIDGNIKFVFTDRHAYIAYAEFSSDISKLDSIDWTALQNRNFRKSDPVRFERYQAEALVYKEMPIKALLGVATFDEEGKSIVKNHTLQYDVELRVVPTPQWYF